MAKRRKDSEEWDALEAQWAEDRAEMARLIEKGRAKLAAQRAAQAERDAALALEEARRARRAERIHRILTLGLGRAA